MSEVEPQLQEQPQTQVSLQPQVQPQPKNGFSGQQVVGIIFGVLILLAIGLLVAEVKVGGFGVLGIGGLVAMVFGMLILVDSPDPAVRIGWFTALSLALPFAAIFLILLGLWFLVGRRLGGSNLAVEQVNLPLSAGPIVVPLSCARCRVEIAFDR